MLTVGDTLQFAAESRCVSKICSITRSTRRIADIRGLDQPKNPPGGVGRKVFASHLRNVIMALLGIIHTANTKVGSDVIRESTFGRFRW